MVVCREIELDLAKKNKWVRYLMIRFLRVKTLFLVIMLKD